MKQTFQTQSNILHFLSVGNVQLAYDIHIPEPVEEKKTQILLLINGFQRTRQDFRSLRQKLARVAPNTITVAFDNPFCGQTKVAPMPESASLVDFAQNALALLNYCKKEFSIECVHVLGISMGGMIAQILASLPECPVLETLFLVSTTAGGAHRVWPPPTEDEKGPPYSAEQLSAYFGSKFLQNSPLLFKMFVQHMQKTNDSPESRSFYQLQGRASNNFNGLTDYTAFKAKRVLIITGDDDKVMPAKNAENLAKLISGSQLIVYPGIGHLILIENPNEFMNEIAQILNYGQ